MNEVQLIFFYITIIYTQYIRHELQYYNIPIYLNLKSNLHRYTYFPWILYGRLHYSKQK